LPCRKDPRQGRPGEFRRLCRCLSRRQVPAGEGLPAARPRGRHVRRRRQRCAGFTPRRRWVLRCRPLRTWRKRPPASC
jgi:hypothetical protein